MAELTQEQILDAFKSMTLLELAEFKGKFEETFGVTAASAMAVMPAGMAPADGGGEEAEQTEFAVHLAAIGDKKIQVIKVIRGLVAGLGLKEAKELVEKAPVAVKEGLPKEEAEEMKTKLEEAGAVIEIK